MKPSFEYRNYEKTAQQIQADYDAGHIGYDDYCTLLSCLAAWMTGMN